MGLLDTIKNKIDESNKKKEEKRLDKLKAEEERKILLKNLSEGNNLPVLMSAPILLQKNEICHFACYAKRYETKLKTVGYEGGYSGVSVRVAKGVTFHTGGTRGHAIKQNVGVEYPGNLYITSKRLIFLGDKKNFTITFNKILGANCFKDGFNIQTEKTTYGILVNDSMYVCAIINGAVSNSLGNKA